MFDTEVREQPMGIMHLPMHLLTSRSELNMPLMKAVFLNIFFASPMSFSFFSILGSGVVCRTVPEAAIRKLAMARVSRMAKKGVDGGRAGA